MANFLGRLSWAKDVPTYEIPLADGSDWRVRGTFVKQAGQWVLAEVTIGPSSDQYTESKSGARRLNARAVVPQGGLTARTLRHVRTEPLIDGLRKHLLYLADVHPTRRKALLLEGDRDDAFYATLVARYLELCGPARSPRRALAEQFPEYGTSEQVRDLLNEARRRKLVTRPGQGRAGGELTERGQMALRAKSRRPRKDTTSATDDEMAGVDFDAIADAVIKKSTDKPARPRRAARPTDKKGN